MSFRSQIDKFDVKGGAKVVNKKFLTKNHVFKRKSRTSLPVNKSLKCVLPLI